MSRLTFRALDRYKEYGAFFIRLLIGVRLIYGVIDNVTSWEQMVEFQHFLAGNGFPLPLVSAVVSVYAQLLGGILFILGLWTRPAAVLMIVNFVIAIGMVHLRIGDTFVGTYQALTMLVGSLFLLLHGAGKPSVDELLGRRASTGRTVAA